MTRRADALRFVVLGEDGEANSALLAALAQAPEPRPRFEGRPWPAPGREWRQTRDADVVLLPVVEETATAAAFLARLEADRGRHAAVAGLPVVVLFPGAGPVNDPAFEAFARPDRRPVGFGQLDVAVEARDQAAERLPDWAQRGRQFRSRRRQATWRLGGAVAAVFVVFALFFVAATVLVLWPGATQGSQLQAAVEAYQSREGGTASTRLREPLAPRIAELTEIARSPEFGRLPVDTQAYVRGRLAELVAYREYLDRLEQSRAPGQVHNDRELAAAEAALQTELAPPAEYAAEWAGTPAVLLRGERLEDAQALRAAVDQEEAWYRQLQEQGDVRWAFGGQAGEADGRRNWPTWFEQATRLLARADAPPFQPADRLPGARRLTAASALRFDRVADARTDWERVRRRLESLMAQASALGLVGDQSSRPAVLAVPAGAGAEEARQRFRELAKAYPGWTEWPAAPLPEAAAADIRGAAEAAYHNLLPAGQELVLKRLQQVSPDGKETASHWREVRDWLATTDDLNGWRDLAALLARLANPKNGDPVSELVAFLSRDRFPLRVGEFALQVPDDLNLQPTGPLVLSGTSNGEARPAATFSLRAGSFVEAKHRRKTYTFVREGEPLAVSYFPGDSLTAEVPVNRGPAGQERALAWADGPSLVFQFDRLNQPPRLLATGARDRPGEAADGVKLTGRPDAVPKLPDLFPTVRLVRK